MSEAQSKPTGPDLMTGIPLAELTDGKMLLGHVGGDAVLLTRVGQELFAIGATCTHYSGPLSEGIIVGDTVRCPWHHACFSLRTGEPLRAPALNPVDCWRVERQGEMVLVREKAPQSQRAQPPTAAAVPESVLILGGGAAGNIAAETLRREGYAGKIVILSADASLPYDRPNLSKDYLAGDASDEWIPLRSSEFYNEHAIEVHLGTRATTINTSRREVQTENGNSYSYDALLIATGAEPVKLNVPGADLPHVHYLRSLVDSRAIIAGAKSAKQVVVIGSSFIGLEVAASLRKRKLDVHVVAPDAIPMKRVLGPEIGSLVRHIHEEHGVRFHLGTTAVSIDNQHVTLATGEKLPADLVIIGIGVRPATALAENAGLAVENGIIVNPYLETSVPGIFAAGDLARWPDPHSGEGLRVEHWVVAERQGQTAARNMLGRREAFDAVPFFWSMHYDVPILYVGHAKDWDSIEIDGELDTKNCRATYRRGGRTLAVATIGRYVENLRAEVELERQTCEA